MNSRISDPSANPTHTEHAISTNGRFANRVWQPEEPLRRSTKELLVDKCLKTDIELCGLIDIQENIHWIENDHEEPYHNFFMDGDQYKLAIDVIYGSGLKVLGVFHSHPNNTPWPTPRDIRGWPSWQLHWRYFIVTATEVIEWELA